MWRMVTTGGLAGALLLTGVAAVASPEKTVFAHFYYWYPVNADIVTHHPPAGHFDRDDVEWWKGELRNAHYAGIDVLALMYWEIHPWRFEALEVMLEAMQQLRQTGEAHPKVCLHLDGIEHVANVTGRQPVEVCDLTDATSNEAVARAFVNFFAFFKEHGALDSCYRHEGKLVAFVYRPEYGLVRAIGDDTAADVWRDRFREALGEELYLVLETAFHGATLESTQTKLRIRNADNYFRWDAALHGPLLDELGEFPIATVGPGLDPRGRGMDDPPLRFRRNGYTFRNDMRQAIRWNAPWLVIETFNFFEEGTDITETQEFGRRYLDISREYTARFKRAP